MHTLIIFKHVIYGVEVVVKVLVKIVNQTKISQDNVIDAILKGSRHSDFIKGERKILKVKKSEDEQHSNFIERLFQNESTAYRRMIAAMNEGQFKYDSFIAFGAVYNGKDVALGDIREDWKSSFNEYYGDIRSILRETFGQPNFLLKGLTLCRMVGGIPMENSITNLLSDEFRLPQASFCKCINLLMMSLQEISKLHLIGIQHNDLHLHNVMVENDTTVVIIDFDNASTYEPCASQDKRWSGSIRQFIKNLTYSVKIEITKDCHEFIFFFAASLNSIAKRFYQKKGSDHPIVRMVTNFNVELDRIYKLDGVFQNPAYYANGFKVISFKNPSTSTVKPGHQTSHTQFYRFQGPDRRRFDTQIGATGIPFSVPPKIPKNTPYMPLHDAADLDEIDLMHALKKYVASINKTRDDIEKTLAVGSTPDIIQPHLFDNSSGLIQYSQGVVGGGSKRPRETPSLSLSQRTYYQEDKSP